MNARRILLAAGAVALAACDDPAAPVPPPTLYPLPVLVFGELRAEALNGMSLASLQLDVDFDRPDDVGRHHAQLDVPYDESGRVEWQQEVRLPPGPFVFSLVATWKRGDRASRVPCGGGGEGYAWRKRTVPDEMEPVIWTIMYDSCWHGPGFVR